MGPLGWRGRVCARGRGVIEHHPEDGFQGGNPLASRPHNRFERAASHETKPLFNRFCLFSLPCCVLRMPPPPLPFPSLPSPLRRSSYSGSWSRDSAPAKPAGEGGLGTSSWEVPRLPEPEPPAAAAGSGGGSPGPDWPAAGRTTDAARLILSSL